MRNLPEPSYQEVAGYCPMGCGRTLVLGERGLVSCSWALCPYPGGADDLLHEYTGRRPLLWRLDSPTRRAENFPRRYETGSAGLLSASEQPGHVAPVIEPAEGCAAPVADIHVYGPPTLAMADLLNAEGVHNLAEVVRKCAVDRPRWWHRFTRRAARV